MIKRSLAAMLCLALCPAAGSRQPDIEPPSTPEPITIAEVLEPLTDLVGLAESDNVGGYDAANNGYPLDLGRDGFLKVFGRSTSNVTVGEILLAQAQRRIHAVGRYQIIGITLRSLVDARCLTGAQLFTEEAQDAAFLCLIKKNRPSVWRFISSGQGLVAAANAMSREWASMPYTHGGSYYGGADAAKTTRRELFEALKAVRALYIGRLGDQGG